MVYYMVYYMSKGKKKIGSRQGFQDGTCVFAKVQYFVFFLFTSNCIR